MPCIVFMRLPSLNLSGSVIELVSRNTVPMGVTLSFIPCAAPPDEREAWTIQPVLVSPNPRRALSFPPADLRLAERPFELRVFDTRRAREVRHAQRSALVRGEKGRVECDVPEYARRPRAAARGGRPRPSPSAAPRGTRGARSRHAARHRETGTARCSGCGAERPCRAVIS